jgi:hypothetical protein
MTEPISQETGRVYPRENSKHWIGVEAADIPQGWMDDMVKRVFDVLNRNLIRLETAQAKVNDENKDSATIVKEIAVQTRLAAQIRNDLAKLRKLEMKRQARKPKVTVSDDDVRAELEGRLDRLVAEGGTPKNPGTPRPR